jgi:PST family polysaccharide transporter
VTNVLRLVVVVVLGRLLAPGELGVVAAALAVTVILHNVRDLGIGPALVQREAITRAHVATAFAVSAYIGVGIAALLALTAPVLGRHLFQMPESIDVLRALGAGFALRGLTTASAAMCQRAMRFRAIALVDASAYGVGTAVAIGLAAAGAGPWALVGGYLAEEALSCALYLRLAPPPLTLRIERARLRELLRYGASQSVIQLAGVLATYGDNLVVANALGKVALGLYTRAYDLIKLPSAIFANVAGNVLFPAFARLQGDRERMASGLRRILFTNALLLLPASAVLIALAPEAIRVLLGPAWAGAITPFRILALTMLFRTSYKVSAMVASAAGLVHRVAIANVVYMALVIGGAIATVGWGVAGVATSTAIALTVMYAHCGALALAASGLSAGAFARAHAPGLLLALVAGAPTWIAARALRGGEAHYLVTLGGGALTGAALTLAGLALALRRGRGDFAWLADELRRVTSRLRTRGSAAPPPAAPPPGSAGADRA